MGGIWFLGKKKKVGDEERAAFFQVMRCADIGSNDGIRLNGAK